MKTPAIGYRLASLADVPALEELIPLSARELQLAYYRPEQIDAAIGTVFGVDTQLIRDGTYFVAEVGGRIVGGGGWSRRKTLYGGDRAKHGEDPLRDPLREPAMIRAFFVHPEFSRRGIGREFVRRSEAAAEAAGFRRIEIVATLAGEPLYAACGYDAIERFDIALVNGTRMPVVRMARADFAPPPETVAVARAMKSSDVSVGLATPELADELTQIAHAAKRHWGYPEAWIERWRAVLTMTPDYLSRHPSFVATIAGEIVGFAVIEIDGVVGRIEHVWVRPPAMGKGVGRALFDRCEAQARLAGVTVLEIESDPHAEEFYQRMGAERYSAVDASIDGVTRLLPLLRKRLG